QMCHLLPPGLSLVLRLTEFTQRIVACISRPVLKVFASGLPTARGQRPLHYLLRLANSLRGRCIGRTLGSGTLLLSCFSLLRGRIGPLRLLFSLRRLCFRPRITLVSTFRCSFGRNLALLRRLFRNYWTFPV